MVTRASISPVEDASVRGSSDAPRRWWLWLSVPIAALAVGSSLTGILVDRIYAQETAGWRAEAIGQDIANLMVFPFLLIFAYAATRGSLTAYLAWLGTLVYSTYTFAIYVFAVHFGPLFLAYVAVFGMAAWALLGGLTNLDASRVRAAFTTAPWARFISALLVVIAVAFALLWLSEDLPAMIDGTASAELAESGLLTNPVHVLDLSLFLPTAVIAGALLWRGRPWGYLLAPVMLVAMAAISVGIVSLTMVHLARGEDGSWVVASVIGALAVILVVACRRFLQGVAKATALAQVLRHH